MITRGVTDARQYMQQKQTERALLALRKRKLYEQSLDRIDAYLLNVEQVRDGMCCKEKSTPSPWRSTHNCIL